MGVSLMLSVDSSWCCSSVVKDSDESFHAIKHLSKLSFLYVGTERQAQTSLRITSTIVSDAIVTQRCRQIVMWDQRVDERETEESTTTTLRNRRGRASVMTTTRCA